MTTLKPDGLMEELKPCPFCGAEPSFDYDEEITECNEIKCSLTKEMHSSTWQNAYCWKLLAEAEKKVRIYREIAIDCEKRYRKESGNVVPYIQHEFVSVEIDQEAERLLKEETK